VGRPDDNPDPDPVTPIHRGVLLALAAFGLYATHDAIIKYLGGSYSPFQIVFFSVLFGFPMVTFLMMRDARPGHLRPVHPWWTALRTLAAVITAASAFYAFTAIPLAQVYAILFAPASDHASRHPDPRRTCRHPPRACRAGRSRRGDRRAAAIDHDADRRPPRGGRGRGGQRLRLGHHAQDRAGGAAVVLILYPMAANFVLMGAAMPFVYEPMPGAGSRDFWP
jgi:hypothetical protein